MEHVFGHHDVFRRTHKPTVSLGVTCAVVDTYGCDNGRIAPTRCAIIAAGLDGKESQCRACKTPPAGAGSAHSALAVASRPVSTAAPGAFHRLSTTRPPVTRPCGDASLPRCAPGTHPCPLCSYPV